jgi:O-antigen/teichoic acid export membrane protein
MHKRILDKLEKRLEMNLRPFMKNFSYMFANNIITIIFALALSVMLARVLSLEVFGQYNFILSIFGLISILSLPGMNTSLTRSCARGFDGSFIEGTKIRVKWGVLGTLFLLIVGLYYYIEGSFLLSFGFMISALFFVSYHSFRTFHGFLMGKKRFKRWSVYLSAITIVANMTTMIIAYYFRNLLIILFVLLGLVSLMNAIFLFKTIRERKNDKIDKDTIPYGKHLTLVNIVAIIKSHLDKILVMFFLGFESVAIYSVAIIIPRQIKPLWMMISDMIFPDLSKKSKKDAYSAVRKRFKYMILLEIAIIVVGIIILPTIISYFYSHKYVEAIFYAQLLMLLTLSGPGIVLVNLAAAQKQLRKVYKISTIPPIIYIILLALLTPLYDLMGACVATVIGAGLIPIIYTWFVIFGGPRKQKV